MIDKKLTDNEIIKALECCDLPVGETVLDGALNLINRQKAEIERLQKHIQEGIDLAKQIPEMVALAQAEAIKQFAERLKADCPANLLVIHFDAIDNLVKEMVGDDNG